MIAEQHNRLVLGTRGSELARAQAALVIDALAAEVAVETKIIRTSGDEHRQPTDLRAGRKGMFTREIERALLEGEIDLAVHSAKDLPSEMTAGLEISAVLPRGDVADVFVSPDATAFLALPIGSVVATSSVRRQHQIAAVKPEVRITDLRGNVPTRLGKLRESDWAGIVLARAGLRRLGDPLATFQLEVLPLDTFVPAGGQGIIAIQTRSDDEHVRDLVAKISDDATHRCLRAEREFLRLLAADCNAPIGVLSTINDGVQSLRAQVFTNGERAPRVDAVSGSASPGELARTLIEKLHGK